MYNFKELDDFLSAYISRFEVDCLALAISNGGKLVFETYKSSEKEKNFSDYTRMNIGSVANTLIGILLMTLIESGEITAYDYVKTHIPEFPCEDIRIIHLLTHTSGITSDEWVAQTDPQERSALFSQIYSTLKKTGAAGDMVVQYDHGYAILIDLIERVSGKTVESFAYDQVFYPLDLRRTSFGCENLTTNNHINSYDSTKDSLTDYVRGSSCGVFSVTHDLLKFGNLFCNYAAGRKIKILSEAGFQFALTPAYFAADRQLSQTPIFFHRSIRDQYLCFGDLSSPGTVGHSSDTGCMLSIDLEKDIVITIMSALSTAGSDQIFFKKIINRTMAAFRDKW